MSNKSLNGKNRTQNKMFVFVSVAMLSAVAFVLMLFEFPILPAFAYLKMDFSDVPAIVGGVIFGPIYSVVIELLKNALQLVTKGMGTQMGFGNLMNFIVGCSFSVPFTIIIRRFFNKSENVDGKALSLVFASAAATVVTVVLGYFGNLLIAPLYLTYFAGMEVGPEMAKSAAVAATAFNPIKCAILIPIMVLFVTLAMPRIKKALKI
ncbi:MAG: ECF transporter S component [Clostridia bacterium]|nr:ECF transporter S component [Clostridia bacterium]